MKLKTYFSCCCCCLGGIQEKKTQHDDVMDETDINYIRERIFFLLMFLHGVSNDFSFFIFGR